MSAVDDLIRRLCPNGVTYRAMSDAGEVFRGRRFTKTDYVDEGLAAIHYGELYTHYGTSATDVVTRVRVDLAPNLRFVEPGDVVIAEVGETLEDVGKAVAWLGSEKVAIHDGCYGFRSVLDPTFVSYYLQTAAFHAEKNRHVARAKVKRLSIQGLRQIRIPVPPLEVQRQIVRVLDSFQSLEAELEAELEARRRQFAHCRDSLLMFDGARVRWLTLGEVVTNLDRLRRPVSKSARLTGIYPYYGANGVQDYVDDFIFDGTHLLMGEDGSVMRADGTPILNWATGKIWVNNHAHVLAETSGRVNLRFLYHYLHTVDIRSVVTGSAQPKLNQANMNGIAVPVPARGEQDRIVAMLDKFDALINDLSGGLLAELVARRRQYEHYRDRLLTFEEAA